MTEGEVEAMESLLPVDLILLGQCLLSLFFVCCWCCQLSSSHIFLLILLFSFVRNYVQVDVLVGAHPWRPSGSQLGREKGATKVFKHGRKIPSGPKTT